MKDGEHEASLGGRLFVLEVQFFLSIDIGLLKVHYGVVDRYGRRKDVRNHIAVTPTP